MYQSLPSHIHGTFYFWRLNHRMRCKHQVASHAVFLRTGAAGCELKMNSRNAFWNSLKFHKQACLANGFTTQIFITDFSDSDFKTCNRKHELQFHCGYEINSICNNHDAKFYDLHSASFLFLPDMVSLKIVLSSHVRSTEIPYWSGRYVTFTQAKLTMKHIYRSGPLNSKSVVGMIFLQIKWIFKLNNLL